MKLLITCLLVPILAVGLRAAAPKQTAVPGAFASWQMAFVRSSAIWTARADGTGQKLVIKDAGAPCWSPDKRKLAFYRQGNIWIANADGRGVRQLTHYGKAHIYSPNEIRISWNARTGGITFSQPVWVSRAILGTTISDLYPVLRGKPALSVRFDVSDTGTGFAFADNENPAWSKSGNVLAFTRSGDIWVSQYAPPERGGRPGWDTTRLAAVAAYDSPTYRASRTNVAATSLSWSPDGTRLAYCRERIGGSGVAQLHVITLRKAEIPTLFVGTDKELLNDFTPSPTVGAYQPEYVSFSPDGEWIAFFSCDSIYAISLDGTRIAKLISNATRPVW